MGSIAKRVHNRRKVIGDSRIEVYYVRLGDSYIFGKSTVFTEDSHRQAVLAHMPHTAAAVAAVSADDMSLGCYALTHLGVAYAWTYLHHLAHELMPHRVGWHAVFLRPVVPLVHVQVGSADGCFLHLDEYIVYAHFGHRHVFHPNSVFGARFT